MSIKSEAIWQAEMDARTLADADGILGDKKRKAAATKAATRLAADADRQARSMKSVAAKKTAKPASKKVPAKKATKRGKK